MPNTDLKPLLELYSTTVFLCSEPISWTQFAIITPCNPKGEVLTELDNDCLLNKMQSMLIEFDFKELTGASPDLLHQEKSFAVKCSKQKAVSLGRVFQQNAIFWVEDGELSIEPAVLQFEPIVLGRFTDRVKT